MDFGLTSEQELLRDTVRDVLARHAGREAVRELEQTHLFPRAAWHALAEIGVLGLTLPESEGGAGGSVLDLVVVIEELGRASLSLAIPAVTTVSQGSKVLSQLGRDDQKARFLPELIAGKLITTLAWTERSLA